MGSPCKLLRLSGALPPGLGGFRSTTAGGSTGASGHCVARAESETRGPGRPQTRGQREDPGWTCASKVGSHRPPPRRESRARAAWQVALLARPLAGALGPPSPNNSLCTAPA